MKNLKEADCCAKCNHCVQEESEFFCNVDLSREKVLAPPYKLGALTKWDDEHQVASYNTCDLFERNC